MADAGALSPLIASMAMVDFLSMGLLGALHCDNLAAVVISAGAADVVGLDKLAAGFAAGDRIGAQRMVRAAHVFARLGRFLFRNSHIFNLSFAIRMIFYPNFKLFAIKKWTRGVL